MRPAVVEPSVLSWLERVSEPCSLLISSRETSKASVFGQAHSGRIAVAQLSLNGVSEIRLRTSVDSVLLVFHRNGRLAGTINRQELCRVHGSLQGVAMPLEDVVLTVETPTATVTLMHVNQALLELAVGLHTGQRCSAELLKRAIRGFELALLPMLDGFCRAKEGESSVTVPLALQRLEVSIISLIVRLMPKHEPGLVITENPEAPKNWVAAAEAVMRRGLSERLNLRNIAEACQCSERTLQLAFQREMGCSPMQRLRELRLDAMQAELADGASVRDACAAAGLAASGRTSMLYQERFGQRPVERRKAAGERKHTVNLTPEASRP